MLESNKDVEKLIEEKVRKELEKNSHNLPNENNQRSNARTKNKKNSNLSRRNFLKKMGAGIISLGFLSLPSVSAIDFKSDNLKFYGGQESSKDFEVDNSGNTYAQGSIYANGGNKVWTESNDGPLLRSFNLNLSSHKLNSGEYTAMHRFTVPSGRSLEVFSVSISNNSHNQPSGLNLVIRNATSGLNTTTYSTAYSDGNPLDSFAVGGDDIIIAVDNGHFTGGSGSMQVVNAHIKMRVE